ncbi:MAG: MATE family efflux transporter, partial [Clostridiales bacterium]|nr:MATE family efflux transporter [Clostridiales bacterium]
AIAIMIGQHLGADRMDEARRDVWRLMFFSVAQCFVIGAVMAILAPYFPLLYNTTDEVRHLATRFLITLALFMPIHATSHASYFTLRSGGSTLMTFIFDAAYVWVINIPLALALTKLTDLPIIILFPLVEASGILKLVLGITIVRSGVWVKNIVVPKAVDAV